ncbi:MAG: hypothetical protein QE273_09630 [Verrucomicrobiales bacterium]|nr:hypothetical protein [Verrucomicrobiales bacterium]
MPFLSSPPSHDPVGRKVLSVNCVPDEAAWFRGGLSIEEAEEVWQVAARTTADPRRGMRNEWLRRGILVGEIVPSCRDRFGERSAKFRHLGGPSRRLKQKTGWRIDALRRPFAPSSSAPVGLKK